MELTKVVGQDPAGPAAALIAGIAYGGTLVHAIRDRPNERARVGIGNMLLGGRALCGVRGSAGGLAWGFRLPGGHQSPAPFDPDAVHGRSRNCPRCTALHRRATR